MSRILSLALIALSGWMLYQSSYHFSGSGLDTFAQTFGVAVEDQNFLFPFIGGLLGMLGGVTVLFGGGGGATIAFCGGLIATGFSLATGAHFSFPNLAFWNNEFAVALAMLGIAAVAGVLRAGVEA